MTCVETGAAAVLSLAAEKDHPPGTVPSSRLVQALVLLRHYSRTQLLITFTLTDLSFLPEDELPHPLLI